MGLLEPITLEWNSESFRKRSYLIAATLFR
jgi:hypothetical protein